MKVITGKVVDGKVELPPGVLDEGESVAILALDDAEPVVLSPEEQRELTDRLEAIARGDYIDGDEFLKELKARHTAGLSGSGSNHERSRRSRQRATGGLRTDRRPRGLRRGVGTGVRDDSLAARCRSACRGSCSSRLASLVLGPPPVPPLLLALERGGRCCRTMACIAWAWS